MPNWPRRRYGLGIRTVDGSNAAATAELIVASQASTSVSTGVYLMEVRIAMAAATASVFGIGRPAAKGVTPTSPVFLLGEDGTAVSAKTSTAVAWGTGPTVPAAFLRRANLPATIGVEQIFLFQNGLFIPPGASVVVWNLAANGVTDINFVVEEG